MYKHISSSLYNSFWVLIYTKGIIANDYGKPEQARCWFVLQMMNTSNEWWICSLSIPQHLIGLMLLREMLSDNCVYKLISLAIKCFWNVFLNVGVPSGTYINHSLEHLPFLLKLYFLSFRPLLFRIWYMEHMNTLEFAPTLRILAITWC